MPISTTERSSENSGIPNGKEEELSSSETDELDLTDWVVPLSPTNQGEERIFTVCFLGTCSHRGDSEPSDIYPRGETVSSIGAHLEGQEGIDYVIVDGPGSGNRDLHIRWNDSIAFPEWRGLATGAGRVQNAEHVLAILKNDFRRTNASPELKQEINAINDQVASNKLQQVTKVNIIAWSRGAVTAHHFAKKMAEDEDLKNIDVNIFAIDPVPGAGTVSDDDCVLKQNVKNYLGVYARDERSIGFTPVEPILESPEQKTVKIIRVMPGGHATLVGCLAAHNQSPETIDPAREDSGFLVRHFAEKFLIEHGSKLRPVCDVDHKEFLRRSDNMIKNDETYKELRQSSYTYFTQLFGSHRKFMRGRKDKLTHRPLTELESSKQSKGLSEEVDAVRAQVQADNMRENLNKLNYHNYDAVKQSFEKEMENLPDSDAGRIGFVNYVNEQLPEGFQLNNSMDSEAIRNQCLELFDLLYNHCQVAKTQADVVLLYIKNIGKDGKESLSTIKKIIKRLRERTNYNNNFYRSFVFRLNEQLPDELEPIEITEDGTLAEACELLLNKLQPMVSKYEEQIEIKEVILAKARKDETLKELLAASEQLKLLNEPEQKATNFPEKFDKNETEIPEDGIQIKRHHHSEEVDESKMQSDEDSKQSTIFPLPQNSPDDKHLEKTSSEITNTHCSSSFFSSKYSAPLLGGAAIAVLIAGVATLKVASLPAGIALLVVGTLIALAASLICHYKLSQDTDSKLEEIVYPNEFLVI